MVRPRIGYIGHFGFAHTETEIADYLEDAGWSVDRYHYTELDQKVFASRGYELVITTLPQCLPVSFWRGLGGFKVAWYFDWIDNYANREKQYMPRLKHFDLVLSTDGFEGDIYKRNGVNRLWLPHALDPRVYHPVEAKTVCNVAFIGHIYTPERKKLLRGIKNLKVYGQDSGCWGKKYSEICCSAKIIVGDNFINVPGYWSDRLYLSVGSGGFTLYPRIGGIENQFTDGEHIVYYDSADDLYAKIDYWLPREKQRREIARAGADHTRRTQTWVQRVAEFEEIIQEVL